MPTFPTEVFERIIDCAWPDRKILYACALTCRAWLYRSRVNLFYLVDLHDTRQLMRLSRLLTADPRFNKLVKQLAIAYSYGEERPSIAGQFPYSLVRKLTEVERLCIYRIRLYPSVGPNFSATLRQFVSITALEITMTTFPSLVTFARILLALPRLSMLMCASVKLRQADYNPSALSLSATPLRLRHIAMANVPWSDALVDLLLASVAAESLRVANLRIIRQEDVSHVERFLRGIGSHLQHLTVGTTLKGLVAEKTPSLVNNPNLRTVHFDIRSKCNWLFTMLSQVTSTQLRRVTIASAAKLGEEELEHLQCKQVDGFLSDRKRFPELCTVVFQYLPRMTTEWVEWWRTQVQARCPRLLARGLIVVEPSSGEWWESPGMRKGD